MIEQDAHLYRPGDVIVTKRGDRLEVMDPPRTRAGKLRLASQQTGVTRTTWWGYRGSDFLPPGFEIERGEL